MNNLVAEIVSVDLISPDIETHSAFYTQVWGLREVGRGDGLVRLAASGQDDHVICLKSGAAAALVAVTYRCAARSDLDEIASRARSFGCPHVVGPASSNFPAGGDVVEIKEPMGSVVRVVHGDAPRAALPVQPDRPTRLSHVNINTTDIDASIAFYRDVLGFRFVDRSAIMAFLSCNSDHHAVVLFDGPVDGLNHVAFMLPEIEGVMIASGQMIDHGYPIGWGVGRHGPGNNVFSYFVDPFGYVVEYTADVLQIDDSYPFGTPKDWVWPEGRSDHWGIAPPKSDEVKKAQLAVPFAP